MPRTAAPVVAVLWIPIVLLGVANHATAQCSAVSTTTISDAKQASALASCTTFTGSIAIATSTTDPIALDGIEEITGSLTASNVTQITQLSGNSLATIQDTFTMSACTILTSANFPRLISVDTIDWYGLPALQGLLFPTGIQQASTVTIQNTQLNTLEGIDLNTVDSLTVSNNPYLNDISMRLGNVSLELSIGSNGRNLTANFPNLVWAFNLTFSNISELGLPSLTMINGSMGVYGDLMSDLDVPELQSMGGTLSISNNQELTSISMPSLKTVEGGFQISDNANLAAIGGLQSLQTVGGAFSVQGNFKNVSLPQIADVRGAFTLLSSDDLSAACNHFEPLSGSNNVIKGTYTCTGNKPGAGPSNSSSAGSSSTPATGDPTPAGDDDSASGSYIGAIIGMIVGGIVFCLLLGLLFFCLRRRRHRRRATSLQADVPVGAASRNDVAFIEQPWATQAHSSEKMELDSTNVYELSRTAAPRVAELNSTDNAIHEADSAASRLGELADTGKLGLGDGFRTATRDTAAVQPSQEQDATNVSRARLPPAEYNNEPFERYPTATGVAIVQDRPHDAMRLASIRAESARLEDDIRRLHLDELREQKRRLDEEIAAMT